MIAMRNSGSGQDVPSSTTIYKWEKKALTWSPVKDIKYSRWAFSNLGTPINTDIGKWCIQKSNVSTTRAPVIDVKGFEEAEILDFNA